MSDLKDELELAHKELCCGLSETAKMHVIAALAIVTANESIEKVIETRPPLKERLVEAIDKLYVRHVGSYVFGAEGSSKEKVACVKKSAVIEAITRELEDE